VTVKAIGYRKGIPFALELVEIGSNKDGPLYLEPKAAADFKRMEAAALAVGIVLHVNTAFRWRSHQERLWNAYQIALEKWKAGGGKRPSLVAKPGHSTHQQGDTVDINRAHDDHTDNGIADGATDQWLNENAHLFGFARDTPSEPWHYRHVGLAS
jgi:LAS superfamily LD-carboxypeptidase LdcB